MGQPGAPCLLHRQDTAEFFSIYCKVVSAAAHIKAKTRGGLRIRGERCLQNPNSALREGEGIVIVVSTNTRHCVRTAQAGSNGSEVAGGYRILFLRKRKGDLNAGEAVQGVSTAP